MLKTDYDESILNKKLVLPYIEHKLKVDNFLVKAQANPLKSVSFANIIRNE